MVRERQRHALTPRADAGKRLVLASLAAALLGAVVSADLSPIRQVEQLSDENGKRLELVLYGGEYDEDRLLRGARVAIRDTEGGVLWDEFDASLHPWLLRAGRFAGKHVIFVGVRKAAIFDPIERPRPFLYELKPDGSGLRKMWLGSSLSRPMITVDFGNVDGRGDDELVALEHTRDGHSGISIYQWRGFGVEAVARGDMLPGATDVRCADVTGDGKAEVIALGPGGTVRRFSAMSLRGDELSQVAELRVMTGDRPCKWEPIPTDGLNPGGVRLSRGERSRTFLFAH